MVTSSVVKRKVVGIGKAGEGAKPEIEERKVVRKE
jgi:hypothetical protein